MARLGLQRQAEAEIALEFGSDLGAISDGSPVVRDEHGSFVQGLHCADLAGVKSLNQRRDDAFGFSGERIGLGHQGLLFLLVVWVGIANRQATQNLSTAISKREVAVQGRMRSRAGRVLLAFLRSATTLRERSSP